jgi:hypothetical protein
MELETIGPATAVQTEIAHVGADHRHWLCGCPVLLDVVSSAFQLRNIAVGSSPYVGDMSSTGIEVPLAPTTDQYHRYLFRLVVVDIPNHGAIVVRAVHTAQTLAGLLTGANPDCPGRPFEILIREPFWQPPGGNISWHLRHQLLGQAGNRFSDASMGGGRDVSFEGNDTALLYRPPLVPYVPPNSGMPLEPALGMLGTWRDNRDFETYIPVYGPGRVVLYASVNQFDPADICSVTPPTDLGAIAQEDRFLFMFPTTAHYGRVAGALTVELWPDCSQLPTRSGKLFQNSDRRLFT